MEISAGEFRAKCLKLMDEVASRHEKVVITKRGKPVAMLVPVESEEAKPLFGYMAGAITVHGDLVEPINSCWNSVE